MNSHLEIESVSSNYGSKTILNELSLSLKKSESACVLGKSGSGKTTLLRAIAGFEQITSGVITLNGQQLSSADITIVPEKRKIGMIFQDFALFPHLNVIKNIEFGIKQIDPDTRAVLSTKMIRLVGLNGLEKAMPHQLSGGQQQRVAIARALIVEPDLLLLDEPFSNIDNHLKQELIKELRLLLLAKEVTAILVTHDQEEAFSFADQLVLINEGHCVESGSPIELYRNPKTRFTAEFLGDGRIVELTKGKADILFQSIDRAKFTRDKISHILIRPEHIRLSPGSGIKLPVIYKQFKGDHTLVEVELFDGQRVLCALRGETDFDTGTNVEVSFHLDNAPCFSG